MTKWDEGDGGRERGPVGLARAWVGVMTRPRTFFSRAIAPGDQAPGLVFAVVVTLAHVVTRFALDLGTIPAIAGDQLLSLVFALLAVTVVIAPLGLHLASAVQTIALIAVVDDRAGVSKTVQTMAYAAAPCALSGVPFEPTTLLRVVPAAAGLPFEVVRIAGSVWAIALLVVGLSVVHRVSVPRAAVAGALPGALVFGYGFGGFGAVVSLTGLTVRDILTLVGL